MRTETRAGRGYMTALPGALLCLVALHGEGCSGLDFDRRAHDIGTGAFPATPLPTDRRTELSLDIVGNEYQPRDAVRVVLRVGERPIHPAAKIKVVLSSASSEDVEDLDLRWAQDGVFADSSKVELAVLDGVVQKYDRVLELPAGSSFYAEFTASGDIPGLEDIAGTMEVDGSRLAAMKSTSARVDPGCGLESDADAERVKPSGTAIFPAGMPVQFAIDELMLWMRNGADLDAFLVRTRGVALDRYQRVVPPEDRDSFREVALVRVPHEPADAERLIEFLQLLGRPTDLVASRPEVYEILGKLVELRLDGWEVSVNPRLEPHAPATLDPSEKVSSAMLNQPAGCLPGVSCVLDVEAAWAYMELWDRQRPVRVGVLDRGFASSVDLRLPMMGAPVECDFATPMREPRCGPGLAQGHGGVAGWHGTAVVQVLSAVQGNRLHSAGVAGQVAVPMLYRYDALGYAFELGAGLKRAVDDGASVINLSAGFAARGLMDVGPDRDLYGDSGPDGLCARLKTQYVAAAASACNSAASAPPEVARAVNFETLCRAGRGEVPISSIACPSANPLPPAISPLRDGIRYATERGVPVVVSAGNRVTPERLPPGLRDSVRAEDFGRIDTQQTMPALIPETIVAGAVDAVTLDNSELSGARVDVWAPVATTFFAPSTADLSSPLIEQPVPLGGSSAAAPFVAGTIALMQSINPALDENATPLAPGEPVPADSNRRGVVDRIRALLRADENSWSNDELVARGYKNQPERERLLDPLALVRAAGAGVLPELTLAGYDDSIGYSELLASDDTQQTATQLGFGESKTGTILSLPTGGTADVDHYRFAMPKAARPQQATISVTYPRGYGRVSASGVGVGESSLSSAGNDETATAVALAAGDTPLPFQVASPAGEDNVYRVRVDGPTPAVPSVRIVEPVVADSWETCANRNITLGATASFVAAPQVAVLPGRLRWRDNGADIGSGSPLIARFAVGAHDVSVTAYEDPAAVARLRVSARSCPGATPTGVEITLPAAPEAVFDVRQLDPDDSRFVELLLVGQGTDAEDGVLSGSSLRWTTTDQDSNETVLLGTGARPTVRLSYGCETTRYVVRLTATDADNSAASDEVTIFLVGGGLC